jgi:phage host-nuclease inhibitor protein Gam
MTTQPLPVSQSKLSAEHQALKEQTAALRREHKRLQTEGGTKEEHRQHSRNLRAKIKELEQHVARLKDRRNLER